MNAFDPDASSPSSQKCDPSITSAITLVIEKAINAALKYDPGTRVKLQNLDDCVIQVSCEQPEFQLFFLVDQETILATHLYEKTADIQISGTLADFISALQSEHQTLADTNINISGKLSLLNQIQAIYADLDIDWEQAITDIVGIVPGHLLSESIRSGGTWAKQQGQFIKDNLADYLTEELKTVPSQPELKEFYHAVDEVNAAVQRAEARINRLIKTRSN